jgi:hypothetical protein
VIATPPPVPDEADNHLLASATLVSLPWDDPNSQLRYDEPRRRLLCHPPASGPTAAKIEHLAMTGPTHARVRVSVDHPNSHPIEFAFVIARDGEDDGAPMARFQSAAGDGLKWFRVCCGAHRLLETDCDVGLGPGILYLGARMAAGAPNHFAWAHFSDLVIYSAAAAAGGSEPASSLRAELARVG